MQRAFAGSFVAVGFAAITAGTPKTAPAQGLAGASIDGVVTRAGGDPIANAAVSMRDSASGVLRTTATDRRGAYRFESVPVGSYRLAVRAMGVRPDSVRVRLHLGDRATRDFVLSPSAQPVDQVVIVGEGQRDAGAGGPAYSTPREALRQLPLLDRNFVGLLAMSPQAIGPGSLWVSGQHARFNAIQIDGASGGDFFGVNLTPGSNAGARAISLEAIEEVRTLIAPFDVRHGGFSGGLINAVTRSGSNQFHASAFSSLSRSRLVGADSAGSGVSPFEQLQYGATAGGPIVRDKLHYFAVAELQYKRKQFTGPAADEPSTGVSEATVSRAALAFRERFGFDPGDEREPELREPTSNFMVKFSWHPSPSHGVELTPFFSRARSEDLSRQVRNLQNGDAWQLSNSGQILRNSTSGLRLKAVSAFNGAANEAIVSVTSINDRLDSRLSVPLFVVQADAPNTYLSAGSVKSSQGTITSHRIIELTDNFTFDRGNHLITLGSQNWIVRVEDNFMSGAWGVWTFNSLDSLERGSPSRFERAIPLRGQPLSDYRSLVGSAYLQDQWRVTPRFRLTAGVRLEIPIFESPKTNEALLADAALGGIDTGEFPSGNVVLAPRIGFSWSVGSRNRTMLRGGAGAFTGRPPFVWLTNAFANTGADQTLLVCTGADGVPAPTGSIATLPTACTGGSSRPTARPAVSYFDESFRFQQSVKYSLGVDHEIGSGWSVAADVGYTVTRNHMTLTDANLTRRGTSGDGRVMYGTITPAGEARPTRLDSLSFGPVYEFGNASRDRSKSATLSVRREWSSGGLIQVGYNRSATRDAMSLAGFSSAVTFRNNTVDGSLEARNLRTSSRDVPHSLVATVIAPAWRGFAGSLYFRARSGTPYAFTVNGDANADGAPRNDLAYIPRSIDDVTLSDPGTWPALDALIEKTPCLRKQRGTIMRRNSCRNAAVRMLDGRVAKRFRVSAEREVEISADVFNIPNLVNRDWGLVRETTAREDVPLLVMSGWNTETNRPKYSIARVNGSALLPPIDQIVSDASRWRMQLALRYDF